MAGGSLRVVATGMANAALQIALKERMYVIPATTFHNILGTVLILLYPLIRKC
jgi:hypothetical protein